MRYLVFNPTWTVPPGIFYQDILPKAKKNPSYLTQNHMRLLDRSGRTVNIDAIDWSTATADHFPYTVRQDPGLDNALGRMKFMFPNKHLVYLHDTPSKDLFERSQRTFSSGCIRVERPLELAELLLDDADNWNREHIQQVLNSGQTHTVFLKEPLPVLLYYWTAEADETGRVQFREDIYGRDRWVLKALEENLRLLMPEPATQQNATLE